jgi:hypothetical protein
MYTIRFTYKGVMCELVESFASVTEAHKIAGEYRKHPGVSHVAVYEGMRLEAVA